MFVVFNIYSWMKPYIELFTDCLTGILFHIGTSTIYLPECLRTPVFFGFSDIEKNLFRNIGAIEWTPLNEENFINNSPYKSEQCLIISILRSWRFTICRCDFSVMITDMMNISYGITNAFRLSKKNCNYQYMFSHFRFNEYVKKSGIGNQMGMAVPRPLPKTFLIQKRKRL